MIYGTRKHEMLSCEADNIFRALNLFKLAILNEKIEHQSCSTHTVTIQKLGAFELDLLQWFP